MSDKAPFSYRPLPPCHTRLLKTVSPHPSLKCELREHAAATLPEYMALSYTWGSQGPTKLMQCGSQVINVTPNIYAALCEISLKAEVADKWFWVDAVCIDQQNEKEKAVEVKRMNLIYTAAWWVLVWLGPADEDSDLAMDKLTGLTNIMTPLPIDAGDREAVQRRLAPADHPVWTAIVKLYNRSWFRRLWILQEVILAKGIFVLCGNRVLPWSTIVDFAGHANSVVYAAVLLQHGQKTDIATNGFLSCSLVENLRKRGPISNTTDFTNLLDETRGREATDQRDRIYGLLGLITDNLRNLIKVDYTWQTSDCYLHICKALITREPTLTILSMASSIQKAPSLPSWCPDLSSEQKETIVYCFNTGFKAGFHDWPSRHSTIEISSHDNSISIPGFRVDVIKKVCRTRYTTFPENESQYGALATKNLAWDAECLALFHETFPERGNDGFEAYSRTHIANHLNFTAPVPPTYALQNDYRNLNRFWTALSQGLESKIDTAAKEGVIDYAKAMALQESRKFIVTEGGRMGLGPSDVRAGDVVCVFYSAAPLFVLRFEGKMTRGMLIGDAFVDGLMDLGRIPPEARGADEQFCVE
ncbi:MAG: hypothetical protein Q9223_000553 [Gallowayella weberi]